MNKNFIKTFDLVLSFMIAGLFSSCQEEYPTADVDNFVLQSMYEIEERCGAGILGCYEFVFPVTLQFADYMTWDVSDYDSLHPAIREWYQANVGNHQNTNRPHLVLPFYVFNDAGEVITVFTPEELLFLRRACIVDTFSPNHHGHHGKYGPCFRLVFPLTLAFRDSSQVTVSTSLEIQKAIRGWEVANHDSARRPKFVFPFTVQKKDGTQIVVNSAEELSALKEECRG